jgi:hypothetical protein
MKPSIKDIPAERSSLHKNVLNTGGTIDTFRWNPEAAPTKLDSFARISREAATLSTSKKPGPMSKVAEW